MKKQELLQKIDNELIEKLYGFCYARTNDSYEAQDLCSDILYALIKTAAGEGEIRDLYGFIWRVARNVYADFSEKRRRETDARISDDPEEILSGIAAEEDEEDDTEELLRAVYRRISYLTRAYREVMIAFYIDGKSTAQIAKEQKISETALRQRLFAARKKVKSEVDKMNDTNNRPTSLSKMDYVIWGSGNSAWGDPRNGFVREFSKHVLWLCFKKPSGTTEIAEELGVPTVYVEEELEILTRGANGKYGLLRKLDSGKYAINFVLFDTDVMEKATALYEEWLPQICDVIAEYIEEHKEEYLSFPYLNKKVDLNLILWQQVHTFACMVTCMVSSILVKKCFSNEQKTDRPFSVFGYVDNGKIYGGGRDSIKAENICGFSEIHMVNIYNKRLQKHFACEHNVSKDPQIQLALKAIDGLAVASLSDVEKEHAAKAIEQGYLYREGDTLYTKILVHDGKDEKHLYDVTKRLHGESLTKEAATIAEKLADLIRKNVPEYLYGEWQLANMLANMPVLDALVEALIERGLLTPPENRLGAEGCWMSVEK